MVATAAFALLSGVSQAQDATAYRKANEDRILAEYFQLLSLPNVASDTAGIARNVAMISTHAENESIRIQNLWDGIETMSALMLMK